MWWLHLIQILLYELDYFSKTIEESQQYAVSVKYILLYD